MGQDPTRQRGAAGLVFGLSQQCTFIGICIFFLDFLVKMKVCTEFDSSRILEVGSARNYSSCHNS